MARPRDPNKLVFRTIRQADWEWLALWAPSQSSDGVYNPTDAMTEAVTRLRSMCPGGPFAFGRRARPVRHRMPRWLAVYAAANGLTRNEAAAKIVAANRPTEVDV
jgi:hypothetical protein